MSVQLPPRPGSHQSPPAAPPAAQPRPGRRLASLALLLTLPPAVHFALAIRTARFHLPQAHPR